MSAASVLPALPLVASAAAETALVTVQPDPGPAVAPFLIDMAADPVLSNEAMADLVKAKIKYVFVIFNENHSFDNEYGTLPGVNGLYSDGRAPRAPAAHARLHPELHRRSTAASVTVQPFRIGPAQNATFVDSVDHSHTGLASEAERRRTARPRWTGSRRTSTTAMPRPATTRARRQGTQFAGW